MSAKWITCQGTASLIEDIDSKLTAKELKYFSEFIRWDTRLVLCNVTLMMFA